MSRENAGPLPPDEKSSSGGIDVRIKECPLETHTCLFCKENTSAVFTVIDGRKVPPLIKVFVCSRKTHIASAISYVLCAGYKFTLEGSYVPTDCVK